MAEPRPNPRPRNDITCRELNPETFVAEVNRASHRGPSAEPTAQIKYLARYLHDHIDVGWMVVEKVYVDRHWVDELTRYYASCFQKPPSDCARIHFFSKASGMDTARFEAVLRDAPSIAAGATRPSDDPDWRAYLGVLNESYRGFCVVRPLPSVPFGRTVLVPPSNDAARRFDSLVPYTVHLAGLELTVRGVAWQQQDWAVAACATTALWSALQRVARFDAHRVPTPPEITDAAVRHGVGQQRPLPSPGLTMRQISDALDFFHFGPASFRVGHPEGDPRAFALILNTYLRSGIPVVLGLENEKGEAGHAVTAVGFRTDRNAVKTWGKPKKKSDIRTVAGEHTRVCNLEFDEIYIHDDRLGPYASARFLVTKEGLKLRIDRRDREPDLFNVVSGAPPLYAKIRTDAGELDRTANVMALQLRKVIGDEPPLAVEMLFTRSGSYVWSLFGTGIERQRLIDFQRTAALSRYVAIIRWWVDGHLFMDTIWDTTDRIRYENWRQHLLGAVCHQARRDFQAAFGEFMRPFGIVPTAGFV